MSESNQVKLIYVVESTYGTTPTDSVNWKTLRMTGESIGANPQTIISNEIRSDRQVADNILVSLQVGGASNFEMSAQTFDDFLEAVMCGTWTTDVLKIGSTDRSYTLEKQFLDLSQNIAFKGMRVGQMDLNFTFNQIVTGAFTFVGNGVTSPSGTSLVGAGTLAAATTTDVLASPDVGTIQVDGGSAPSPIRSIQLSLNNNMRPTEALGNSAPLNQRKGRATITGTIEAYFDDVTLYNKLINNTAASLSWVASDGTNSYTFLLPKIKFGDGNPTADAGDQDVIQTLSFTALYDATEATSLKVTRAP